ncbi:type III polyketide synthase [Cerasicoccus maritimus]|uniref:type III polyketide synthase n=1 Tax=Cerasicoccus maritimus TaxID=490089 RepID=UPI0028526C03|nr:stilbene synthase [Cerasicoccus maritimus]
MYLLSLASRVPTQSYTQSDCWEIIQQSDVLSKLTPRSGYLLDRILNNQNGIDKRHFAIDDMSQLFSRTPQALNEDFQRSAPALAGDALRGALEQAKLRAKDLDALIVCTCTGYLCPGVSSYVAEQLGLRGDCYLQDLVGLGCGAAIPTLRNAAGFLAANPKAKIGVIAVEICSAAFFVNDDPGVLVSLCLFGDGASASIWTGNPPGENAWRMTDFDTIHQPENRELLRFVNHEGFLRNQLDLTVPQRAGEAVRTLYERQQPTGKVVAHAGGRDVIEALREVLPGQKLAESESVLRQYGNVSSPSVLMALEAQLAKPDDVDDLWLTSFGAGFAAHACRMALEHFSCYL